MPSSGDGGLERSQFFGDGLTGDVGDGTSCLGVLSISAMLAATGDAPARVSGLSAKELKPTRRVGLGCAVGGSVAGCCVCESHAGISLIGLSSRSSSTRVAETEWSS